MSQTSRLLTLLREAGPYGITSLQALRDIGTLRLAARVWDLRKAGFDIEASDVRVGGAIVARYVLRETVQLELAI